MDFPTAASSQPETSAKEPGPLLICPASDQTSHRVVTALAKNDRVMLVNDLAALTSALNEQPEARALVLYESAVSRLLDCDHTKANAPSAALSDWSTCIREILALQTRNRRRLKLAEANSALIYIDIFLARFGLNPSSADDLASLPRREVDPVMLSLARACLHNAPDIRRLSEKLDAATTELSNSAPDPVSELESAVAHYSRVRLTGDNLESEAHSESNELDRLRRSHAELTRERDELRKRVDDGEADLETQYRRSHILKSELEEARQRLGALEAEAEANAAQIDELSKTRADLEHWLNGILASRSYRVLAPLRRIRASFKRNG